MKIVVLLVSLLMLLVPAKAEDQVWSLTDGRVVTVSKVLSQTPTHVTVRCAEGLLQIDKRKLPPEVQEKYPYDGAAAANAESQQRQEQALRETLAARERAMAERRNPPPPAQAQPAVRIVSVRATGPAEAYVTIENRTAEAVDVGKDSFSGVNVVGATFPSVRFTNLRGDILKKVRIPAGATAEVGVVFNIPEGEVRDIGTVRWK